MNSKNNPDAYLINSMLQEDATFGDFEGRAFHGPGSLSFALAQEVGKLRRELDELRNAKIKGEWNNDQS